MIAREIAMIGQFTQGGIAWSDCMMMDWTSFEQLGGVLRRLSRDQETKGNDGGDS